MTVFLLKHDGLFRNLMVSRHPNLEAANAASDATKAVEAIVVAIDADLSFPGPTLVRLHNALLAIEAAGKDENLYKPVNKFATKADAQRRTFALIEAIGSKAPEAAAPPTAGEGAANDETSTNEDEMKKGKKTKAAKPKKAPGEKKAKSAGALVREETYMGRILKFGVEGTKSLAQLVVLSKIADNGRNSKSRVKFRAKKVAALVGGSFSIDEKEIVTIKLPAGKTLDKIFGK